MPAHDFHSDLSGVRLGRPRPQGSAGSDVKQGHLVKALALKLGEAVVMRNIGDRVTPRSSTLVGTARPPRRWPFAQWGTPGDPAPHRLRDPSPGQLPRTVGRLLDVTGAAVACSSPLLDRRQTTAPPVVACSRFGCSVMSRPTRRFAIRV